MGESEEMVQEQLRQIMFVAEEKSFTQVEKLEGELKAMSSEEEEEGPQSPLRDLFDIYLLYTFLMQTPWTCIMILATSILDVYGPEVPQRAAALQSMAETLRQWNEVDLDHAGKVNFFFFFFLVFVLC